MYSSPYVKFLDAFCISYFIVVGSRQKNADLQHYYKKIDLLIIDEWLLTDLSEEQVLKVFEIVEARFK